MMFRSKVPLLLLIALVGYAIGYDEEDDVKRKAECGLKELPVKNPADPTKDGSIDLGTSSFLVRVWTSKNDNKPIDNAYSATGSYVSPVHIITSAQAVLDSDEKWLFDKTAMDKTCNAEKHIQVPDKYVKQLRVGVGACANNAACVMRERRVKTAYLLKICDNGDGVDFSRMFRPLMLEMEETEELDGWPCLADVPVEVRKDDSVRLYGYEFKENIFDNPTMSYRQRKLAADTKNMYWLVPKYKSHGDRGGPMLGFYDGRWFLIGVGASPAYIDRSDHTYFFKTKIFDQALCSYFKICGRQQLAETFPPRPVTTPEPTTTEKPTDPPTVATQPTTVAPTTFAPPRTVGTPATRPALVTPARTEPPKVEPTPAAQQDQTNAAPLGSEDDLVVETGDFLDGAVGLGIWSSVLVSLFYFL